MHHVLVMPVWIDMTSSRLSSLLFSLGVVLGLTPALFAANKTEGGIADFPKLSAERDWPWWRGPTRNGVANDPANAKLPTRWSATENVVWKSDLPGRGHSSPIVVAGKIYLTTADEARQVQSVIAFDAATGKQLWKTDVSTGEFPPKIHEKNTHASPTVACDGERLYCVFNHHKMAQAVALDLDGKVLWRSDFAAYDPKEYPFGYAPSPVLYKDKILVAAESDSERSLIALDRATGKQLWKTPRKVHTSYSTPSVAHLSGRDQLIMSGGDQITSYDPATGKQLWTANGTAAATCGTAVWDGDVVIASGGYPKHNTSAVKADGSGKVLWSVPQSLYEPSLLAATGHVYGFTGNGMLFCWQTADGKPAWKQRLKGPVSASPVLANGHVYWSNELGTTFVFRTTGEKFDLVAENQLGDESMASPAIAGGRLFLRVAHTDGGRREVLYCIGEK